MNDPTEPMTDGALTNFGAALGPLLLLALEPLRQQGPAAYGAILDAFRSGEITLELRTRVHANDGNALALAAVDATGKPTIIATLRIAPVVLN